MREEQQLWAPPTVISGMLMVAEKRQAENTQRNIRSFGGRHASANAGGEVHPAAQVSCSGLYPYVDRSLARLSMLLYLRLVK